MPADLFEAQLLTESGMGLMDAGKYLQAYKLFIAALNLIQHAENAEPFELVMGEMNVGNALLELCFYERATKRYQKARNYFELDPTRHREEFSDLLFQFGLLHEALEERTICLDFHEKSLEIRQSLFGDNHPKVAESQLEIARCMLEQPNNKLDLCWNLFLQGKNTISSIFGPESKQIIKFLHTESDFQRKQKNKHKAFEILKNALRLCELNFGENHPLTAFSYAKIGVVASNIEDFALSLKMKEQSLLIRINILGIWHLKTATSYASAAITLNKLGNYSKALLYYEKNLKIKRIYFDLFCKEIMISYSNIAANLEYLGLYNESRAIYEEILFPENIVSSTAAANLANRYSNYSKCLLAVNQPQKAKHLALIALKIRLCREKKDPLNIAMSLSRLGDVWLFLGEFEKALLCHRKSALLREKTIRRYNQSLISIGETYLRMGQYSTALEYLQDSVEYFSGKFGDDHPDTRKAFNYLAETYEKLNLKKESIRYRLKYIYSYLVHQFAISNSLSSLAQIDNKKRHIKYIEGLFRSLTSLISESDTTRRKIDNDFLIPILEAWFSFNGSINALTNVFQLMRDKNPRLADQFEELERLRKKIESNEIDENQRQKTVDESKVLRNEIYSQAGSLFPVELTRVDMTALLESFSRDTVLISYVVMEADIHAFVLKKDDFGKAVTGFVPLGPRHLIENLINQLRYSITGNSQHRPIRLDEYQGINGRELYRLLIQKLEPHLEGAKSLIIAPDDILYAVPFDALQDPKNDQAFLGQRFTITITPTPRDLLRVHLLTSLPSSRQPNSALLFGDPAYSHPDDPPSVSLADSTQTRGALRGGVRASQALAPLPGTRVEVEAVANRIQANGLKALVGVGPRATAQNLLKLRRPRILHLSTHGQYIPLEQLPENERERAANPFSRVRIALSGANHSLDRLGGDGFITAHDLARMDLTGTRLVVLNACESGIGDTQPGEGVASLSQAVFMAGALATLTTLWPVYDVDAAEFTQRFYELWIELGHAGQALAATKRESIANGLDPVHWAGYVLNGLPSVSLTDTQTVSGPSN